MPVSSCRPPAGVPRLCCRLLRCDGAGGSSRGADGGVLGRQQLRHAEDILGRLPSDGPRACVGGRAQAAEVCLMLALPLDVGGPPVGLIVLGLELNLCVCVCV